MVDLKGCTLGSETAKQFARESGINAHEYEDALEDDHPAIDGPRGVKTLLDTASMRLMADQDLMVSFRLSVIEKVMRHAKIGKYAPTSISKFYGNALSLAEVVQQNADHEWGPFRNLLIDVVDAGPDVVKDPLLSAAAGYAMELAIVGMYVSGLARHQIIEDKENGILTLKADIGADMEMNNLAVSQALELAQRYFFGINGGHVAKLIEHANAQTQLRKEGEPALKPDELFARLQSSTNL
jgi:hypothetical protein